MTRITTTTKLPHVSLLLGAVTALLLPGVSALAVSDNTVRCEPHPTLGTEEGLDVCVGSFFYYYIPPWLGDTNTGYSWIYTFVDDGNNNEGVGERVFVKTDLDYASCQIGLGYPSTATADQICQSCSYCGDAGRGPDERTNGLFQADCTNLPGGRMIDCESTFPYFFPVDFWDDEYLSQGSTTMVPETAAPSSGDSYEASGMGTSDPSSNSDSSDSNDDSKSKDSKDSKEDDSVDIRTYSSDEDDKKKPSTATYKYQSEMKIRMDVSPDNNVSTMDAEVVLEKYKKFLQQQPSLSDINPIDLTFESHETQTVMRLDGATVGTVIIKFETKLGISAQDQTSTPKQVATSMAQQVNWSDFIVNYLRNTQGGSAFKRTSNVNLKLIGEGGGSGGGRVRRLGVSTFEVTGEGSV